MGTRRWLPAARAATVALSLIVSACASVSPDSSRSPAPSSPSPIESAGTSVATSPPLDSPSVQPIRSASPRPAKSPSAKPPARAIHQLPALVGTIGDSLTKAFGSDGTFGDHPGHSWAIGSTGGDGVLSHLERLRALGARPRVVDASRSGAETDRAVGMARIVVDAAARLPRGATAYVTFELGANDACDDTPASAISPEVYAAHVRAALRILETGLPQGSTVLVLSVPDIPRVGELFAGNASANQLYRAFRICPDALGPNADPSGTRALIARYNRTLRELCRAFGHRVTCIDDQSAGRQSSLFGAPFTRDDLSRLDYFHPSLAGQAQIAKGSWGLTPWG